MARPGWEVDPGSSDKQKVLAGRLGMAGTREEENCVGDERKGGSKPGELEGKGAGGWGTRAENRGWCGMAHREQG